MHERDGRNNTTRQQEPRHAAALGCSRAAKIAIIFLLDPSPPRITHCSLSVRPSVRPSVPTRLITQEWKAVETRWSHDGAEGAPSHKYLLHLSASVQQLAYSATYTEQI